MSQVFPSHRIALLRISVKDDGASIDEAIKRLLCQEGPAWEGGGGVIRAGFLSFCGFHAHFYLDLVRPG
jgi:hypothetical protein